MSHFDIVRQYISPWRLVTCLLGPLLLSACAEQAPPANLSPRVIAHQGGVGQWPSNTLWAFRQAANLSGVDELEMDIRQTADGFIVLMHDESVDRTTDGSGRVQSMNLATLQSLDAGYRWSADGIDFPFRGKGVRVPRLAEVFAQHPDALMSIEIKQQTPSLVDSFCQLIRDFGKTRQVRVSSFHHASLVEFRQSCPGVSTTASAEEAKHYLLASKVGLGRWFKPDADHFQLPLQSDGVKILTAEFVAQVHRHGFTIDAWTINDGATVVSLMSMGIDGIITDYPERILNLINE